LVKDGHPEYNSGSQALILKFTFIFYIMVKENLYFIPQKRLKNDW